MIDNIIRFSEDKKTVQVIITRKNGEQHQALFDAWLWPSLRYFHFWVHRVRHKINRFYVMTSYKGKTWFAHRLVMEPFLSEEYPEVDHQNYALTLDNRVQNLRVVNRSEQMNNTSRVRRGDTIPKRQTYFSCQ